MLGNVLRVEARILSHQLGRRKPLEALPGAKALNGARIGVVGGLAMTFYNMEVSTSDLMTRLGVDVAHHDIHELTGRMVAADEGRVSALVRDMAAKARVDGVSDAQMALTARAATSIIASSSSNTPARQAATVPRLIIIVKNSITAPGSRARCVVVS